MCIVAWVWQSHPVYKLLLLFNRDEYHDRPADPVGWWGGSDGEILGGRDLQAGGTWLGCTKGGRVAFLTNVRVPDQRPDARSRGDLPRRFLESKKSPLDFADEIVKEADDYNGFNLVLADIGEKDMVYITNRDKPISVKLLSPGLYVLSNGTLDTPWPKTERLQKNLEELLRKNGDNEVVAAEMFEKLMGDTVEADRECLHSTGCDAEFEKLMGDPVEADRECLHYTDCDAEFEKLIGDTVEADRECLPYTGCDAEFEHKTSSIFVEIKTEKGTYGTRSTSVLVIKRNGDASFYERYLESGAWKEKTVQFTIENDAINS